MLLGIDFGTSSIKLALFDPEGFLLESASAMLDTTAPGSGQIELDPEQGWGLLIDLVQELSSSGQSLEGIAAVGLTGTTQLNFWDSDMRPLRPAILYGDERLPSHETRERIEGGITAQELGKTFGLEHPSPNERAMILRTLPASKWLWIWENQPALFQQVKKVTTTSHGFLASRFVGKPIGDLYDAPLNKQIAGLFGLELPAASAPPAMGARVGELSQPASRDSGLPEGIPVIFGGVDSQMSLIGSGITEPGQVLNQSGTTDVIALAVKGKPATPNGYRFPYFLDPLWILSLAPIRGGALQWAQNLLQPGASKIEPEAFYQLASGSSAGAEGLIALPYFQGEKGVVHDPAARGLLLGLSAAHTREDLARSVLEGMALSFREIVAGFQAAGYPVSEIRVAGGGAQSLLFNQIKADVLQRQILVPEVAQTGCLGAAAAAAVNLGIYSDLKTAAEVMTRTGIIHEPIPGRADLYAELFHIYQQVYPANRELFLDLATWRNRFLQRS